LTGFCVIGCCASVDRIAFGRLAIGGIFSCRFDGGLSNRKPERASWWQVRRDADSQLRRWRSCKGAALAAARSAAKLVLGTLKNTGSKTAVVDVSSGKCFCFLMDKKKPGSARTLRASIHLLQQENR
jgi:hypothetical protein